MTELEKDKTIQPKFSVAIKSNAYQKLINETLGDPVVAKQFVADITTVVSTNYKLSLCDAGSILSAGLVAQTLKLPLSPTLGFAYVIPYGTKAQFQIGWKGLVQLAQRTGLYKSIGVRPVHEGEQNGQNKFGEDLFKFSHEYDNAKVVGYYAYFELLNGFEKTIYWTKEQCEAHAKLYSKSYGTGKDTDNWTNRFDEMALKTCLKQLVSKWGPLSVELQTAIKADQAEIGSNGDYVYPDNTPDESKPKTTVHNRIVSDDDGVLGDGIIETVEIDK